MLDVDLGKMVEPLNKLIDAPCAGIGGLAAPWQTRRIAMANADAVRIEAEGERDVTIAQAEADLVVTMLREQSTVEEARALVGFAGRGISPLQERAFPRLVQEEARRQGNLEAIARRAVGCLPAEVNAEPVDPDWAARFVTRAKEVSQEDMQAMWAEVLAREVARPGSFSLATLDVLANLTRREAELFERLAMWSFATFVPAPSNEQNYLSPPEEIAKSTGLKMEDLMCLRDHQLVALEQMEFYFDDSEGDTRNVTIPLSGSVEGAGRHLAFDRVKGDFEDFSIPELPLSTFGAEIAGLIQREPTPEILAWWASCFDHVAQPGDSITFLVRGEVRWRHTWPST